MEKTKKVDRDKKEKYRESKRDSQQQPKKYKHQEKAETKEDRCFHTVGGIWKIFLIKHLKKQKNTSQREIDDYDDDDDDDDELKMKKKQRCRIFFFWNIRCFYYIFCKGLPKQVGKILTFFYLCFPLSCFEYSVEYIICSIYTL